MTMIYLSLLAQVPVSLNLKKHLIEIRREQLKFNVSPKFKDFLPSLVSSFYLKRLTRMILQFSPLSSGYFPALSSAHTIFFFQTSSQVVHPISFRPGASDMQLSMHVVLPQKVHCIYKYWFIQQSRWKRDWRKDFEQ